MKTRALSVATILLALTAVPASAERWESLKGLNPIRVKVDLGEHVPENLKEADVLSDVRLALKARGIPLNEAAQPYLEVHMNGLPTSRWESKGKLVYSVTLSLWQPALTDAGWRGFAATWYRTQVGSVAKNSRIREDVQELVDDFVTDYQRANH